MMQISTQEILEILKFWKIFFVNIHKNAVKEAVNNLNNSHIKGFKVLVETANKKENEKAKFSKKIKIKNLQKAKRKNQREDNNGIL